MQDADIGEGWDKKALSVGIVNVSLLQHLRLTNHGEPRRPPPRGWWGRPAPMWVALPTHPHLLVWVTIEQFLPVGTT